MVNGEHSGLYASLDGIEQIESWCSRLPLDLLRERLDSVGVLSKQDFDSVLSEVSAIDEAANASLVADALVRTNRISKYQLWSIAHGEWEHLSLGEYTVVEPLGAGGMGEVLLAVHRRMKRKVAIKFLPKHFANDDEMVKRFEREVEVAARLSHPNIVNAFDAGRQGDTHFLVMEYIDGCDLGTLLRTTDHLSFDHAVKCVLQAGKGIAHAHSQGIVHRDIKPSNLLIDREGHVRVLDMGLARWSRASAESSASDLSVTGAVMGTVDFMAPEQATSAKTADHRADIYSLACTLYMLVNGKPVFEGDTVIEKILAHQGADRPRLVSEATDRSAEINAVFMRMMARQPEERHATMEDACGELSRLITGSDLAITGLELPERNTFQSFALQDTKNKTPDNSLISTVNLSDELPPSKAAATAGKGSKWFVALVLLLAMAGGAFWGVPLIVKLVTPKGTLVVKCYVEGAVVQVDGENVVRVTDPDSGKVYRFALPDGDYEVRAVLDDGTVLHSERLQIRSRDESLFEVFAEVEPRGPPQKESPSIDASEPQLVQEGDAVLTVAKDGSAEYQSIGAAVNEVEPGQVIRIIDDGTYAESLMLSRPERMSGVTIESTGGATWTPDESVPRILLVRDVPGLKLRSIKFELKQAGEIGVVFLGDCRGSMIENCVLTSPPRPTGPLLIADSLEFAPGQEPLIVRHCRFEDCHRAVQVSGWSFAQKEGVPCGGFMIQDCQFEQCLVGINIGGEVHDLWVVQSTFHNVMEVAVQFQHLLGGLDNVLVANNSFSSTLFPIRTWEDGIAEGNVRIVANLSLAEKDDNWMAVDSGGDLAVAKGPGDGKRLTESWRFENNIRVGTPPPPESPEGLGWIPLSSSDQLLEQIDLASYDSSSADFLRPLENSIVATGGLGDAYPVYVGAVSPDPNEEASEWKVIFDSANVLSRLPENTVTVSKSGPAHFTTLGEALAEVEPGMTIQIVDDSIYEETLSLDRQAKYQGITIEATHGATLKPPAENRQDGIVIELVSGVTIRGLNIEMPEVEPRFIGQRQRSMTAITVLGSCPGCRFESLSISGAEASELTSNGFCIEFIDFVEDEEPIVIQDCMVKHCNFGIRVTGLDNDYSTTRVCRGLAVLDNQFSDNAISIALLGEVSDILIAGNTIVRSVLVGIQWEQIAEESHNIVVVNNTLARCRFGIRLWTGLSHGSNFKLFNNMSVECGEFDWSYFETGGNAFQPEDGGDMTRINTDWERKSNFREGKAITETRPFAAAWMPPADEDTLVPELHLVSRDATDEDFLRPSPASPLVSQGLGGQFPTYVGSNPPEGAIAFDWMELMSEVLSEPSSATTR